MEGEGSTMASFNPVYFQLNKQNSFLLHANLFHVLHHLKKIIFLLINVFSDTNLNINYFSADCDYK